MSHKGQALIIGLGLLTGGGYLIDRFIFNNFLVKRAKNEELESLVNGTIPNMNNSYNVNSKNVIQKDNSIERKW